MKFDFEAETRALAEHLNDLKSLTVQEYTFRKKYEEIRSGLAGNGVQPLLYYVEQAKRNIWTPSDIQDEERTVKEIECLRPDIVLAWGEQREREWLVYRIFESSHEFENPVGRFHKWLVIDEGTGKVLGVVSLSSDFGALKERDDFIGWTHEQRFKEGMLRHTANGQTLVATQPFGSNFLGGKLVCGLAAAHRRVRQQWELEHGDVLVGMTTTSLYGRPSIYDSHKFWKCLGESGGEMPIKPADEVYQRWREYLKQTKPTELKRLEQKNGKAASNAKARIIDLIFATAGIRKDDFRHGHQKGIYWAGIYENAREFLRQEISKASLKLNPKYEGQNVIDWWRPRAIERYRKLRAEGRLNPNKTPYDRMATMPYDYQSAKEDFAGLVGR